MIPQGASGAVILRADSAYNSGLTNDKITYHGGVEFDIEGFLWNYTNQQVSHVGLDLSGRTAQFIQNIGTSRIKGVEVEGRVLATRTTLLSADVQYLDARNTAFTYQQGSANGAPLSGCTYALLANPAIYNVNCAGKQSYNSPKFTINLTAQQTFDIGDYKLVAGGNT